MVLLRIRIILKWGLAGEGVGYDVEPPTQKIWRACTILYAPKKILANFELFFESEVRPPYLSGGGSIPESESVCIRCLCDPPPYRRRDTLRATPTLYPNGTCIATFIIV